MSGLKDVVFKLLWWCFTLNGFQNQNNWKAFIWSTLRKSRLGHGGKQLHWLNFKYSKWMIIKKVEPQRAGILKHCRQQVLTAVWAILWCHRHQGLVYPFSTVHGFVHEVCSHHRSDWLVLLSSCCVKLRACQQEWDEPRIQLIIFNCSIEQLWKDLPQKKSYVLIQWAFFSLIYLLIHLLEVKVSPCCPVWWYHLQMPQGTEHSRIWAEHLNLRKDEMHENRILFSHLVPPLPCCLYK